MTKPKIAREAGYKPIDLSDSLKLPPTPPPSKSDTLQSFAEMYETGRTLFVRIAMAA